MIVFVMVIKIQQKDRAIPYGRIYLIVINILLTLQIIVVAKRTMHLENLYIKIQQLLTRTIDGCAYFCGAFTANQLFGSFPLKPINESVVGKLIDKYVPKGFFGSLIVYLILLFWILIYSLLRQNDNYFMQKYYFSTLSLTYVTAITVAIVLSGRSFIDNKFLKQISQYGQECLLFSEIMVFKIQMSVGEIKIGPENGIVVFIVAIGVLTAVLSMLKLVHLCILDLLNMFSLKFNNSAVFMCRQQ
ncbi:Hypothetical_protein [Hexamita inflata]|uniref:Hypothetical_protein n=1 Tax=Hexamita inflata TaxID=28002 RepID=A0AA86UC59_9EUKA|nr:Hypothetical protein HINF_LOCUS34141 [Hexamita inflata]